MPSVSDNNDTVQPHNPMTTVGEDQPDAPEPGVNSFLLVDAPGTTSSMHGHYSSTNSWRPEDARGPNETGTGDNVQQPPAIQKVPTPASSLLVDDQFTAQSASIKAGEAASQWAGEDTDSAGKTSASPGIAPRTQSPGASTTPSECIPRSPKLPASFGGSSKLCTNNTSPSACKGETEKMGVSTIANGIEPEDWMWYAVGAIAVAGALFGAGKLYRYVQRGSSDTP